MIVVIVSLSEVKNVVVGKDCPHVKKKVPIIIISLMI